MHGEALEAGLHVSIAGGLANAPGRAAAEGCDCFQVFLGSPRSWRPPLDAETSEGAAVVEAFRHQRAEAGLLTLAGHGRYVMNPASADEALYQSSLELLVREVVLSERLGAELYVLHPGHNSEGLVVASRRLCGALEAALEVSRQITILLEATAERADKPGGNLPLLAELSARHERLGLCLDLAHLFAQGYDFRHAGEVERLIKTLEDVGLSNGVRLIHANDSFFAAGSHRDRHWHVAAGALGRRGYLNILSREPFRRIPWILETPKEPKGSDRRNLRRLKRLAREAPAWNSTA